MPDFLERVRSHIADRVFALPVELTEFHAAGMGDDQAVPEKRTRMTTGISIIFVQPMIDDIVVVGMKLPDIYGIRLPFPECSEHLSVLRGRCGHA